MSGETATISVAMATYNGEQYIQEQLDSIATQIRLPDEIVVGDDQSTDRTLDIIEEFSKQKGLEIRIHKNEARLGTAKNFENIIRLCKGEIVVFSDQDDVWRPDKLRRIEIAFLQNPSALFVFSDGFLMDGSGKLINGSVWERAHFLRKEQALYHAGRGFEVLLRHNFILGCTMAIRRSASTYALPIETALLYHDYWIACALEAKAPGVCIDEPLITYRVHSNQQAGFFTLRADAIKRTLIERNETYYIQEAEAFRRVGLLWRNNDVSSSHLHAIGEKIKFSEIRASMRSNPFNAPLQIARGFWKGYYSRFTLKQKILGLEVPLAIPLDLAGSLISFFLKLRA